MISHKNKCIFIHIPKTAGSSFNKFYFSEKNLNWQKPNYELLYGWCPKRKIHLQHATSQQLIELELISEKHWKEYFKFTFTRNPWDRAYSDYLWMKKDRKINDSFENYITRSGKFKEVLNNDSNMTYRGDHLTSQSSFFDLQGEYKLDFVGKFEDLINGIENINKRLNIKSEFNIHKKKNKNRYKHYSFFYTKSYKKYVDEIFKEDIESFGYSFHDQKNGLMRLKNLF